MTAKEYIKYIRRSTKYPISEKELLMILEEYRKDLIEELKDIIIADFIKKIRSKDFKEDIERTFINIDEETE